MENKKGSMTTTKERTNRSGRDQWGMHAGFDLSEVLRSCIGYAESPGWYAIHETVKQSFGGFNGLRTIELGCGLGKMSLLFSLLGADTTLMDYAQTQLGKAEKLADAFNIQRYVLEGNILETPAHFSQQFDVSMSFGTVEHFFGEELSAAFAGHYRVLKQNGMTVIWVPNRMGFLFHAGRKLRQLFRKSVCEVDEISFTRNMLKKLAINAGFTDIKITGGQTLGTDFNNFILNIPKLFGLPSSRKRFMNQEEAKKELIDQLTSNRNKPGFLVNHLSYPLVLIARKNG